MDEGGKVPVPQGEQDTPPPSTQEKPVGANVNGPSSMSDAINRFKNAWAKGGKVKHYDDGGTIVAAPGTGTTTPPTPPKPISKNEVDNAGGWSGAFHNAAKELGISKAEGGKVDDSTGQGITKINPDKENKLDYNQIRKEKREMNRAESNKPKLPKRIVPYAEGGAPLIRWR